MANLLDLIGRILISALFLISAYNKIFSIDGTMGWMQGFGVPGFLLYQTIALEIIFFVSVSSDAILSSAGNSSSFTDKFIIILLRII